MPKTKYFLLTSAILFGLFSTTAMAEPAVNLPIPFYKQEQALSCEAASLKMALHAKGSPVTEEQLMAIFGVDPSHRQGNKWGDPNKYYVGNVKGRQNSTGYGVHWDPVARAAQVFAPNSHAFVGWNSVQVAKEIEAGNPVIMWGVGANAKPDGWYTPEGNYVAAWVGEHTRTVVGFTGSSDDPRSFILHDPITGRFSWSRAAFERNWSTFNNAGVVVK